MDLVLIPGLMVENTRDYGLLTNNMVKVSSHIQMANNKNFSTTMENL